jgi:hypothetical protein
MDVCNNGNLEFAKWIKSLIEENKLPLITWIDVYFYALEDVKYREDLNMTNWLDSFAFEFNKESLFSWAKRNEYKKLLTNSDIKGKDIIDFINILENYNEKSSLYVTERIFSKPEKLFKLACKFGNFKIIKWLYNYGIIDIESEKSYNYYFSLICISGYSAIAEWMVEKIPYIWDRYQFNIHYFRNTCVNGHLEMAKWIKNKINLDVKDDQTNHNIRQIILQSCEKGQLEIVKWLNDEYGFVKDYCNYWKESPPLKASCEKGQLEIAKWVYELIKENKEQVKTTRKNLLKNEEIKLNNNIKLWLQSI